MDAITGETMRNGIRRICCLCIFVCGTTFAVNAETFRIGTFVAEPVVIEEPDGAITGVNVDYFSSLARRMGYTAEFVIFPFQRMLTALEAGEVDAVINLTITPEREQNFVFSSHPAYISRPCFVVMKDGPITDIKEPRDIRGLRIAYTSGGSLPHFFDAIDYKLVLTPQVEAAESQIKLLSIGRVDAVYSPSDKVISFYVQKFGDPEKMTIVYIPAPSVDWYAVFSKKSAAQFKTAYDSALRAQLAASPYDAFYENWIRGYLGSPATPPEGNAKPR